MKPELAKLFEFPFSDPIERIALIDGKEVPYDFSADNQEFEYPGCTYIGRGVIHSINGKMQMGDRIYYFWKKRNQNNLTYNGSI